MSNDIIQSKLEVLETEYHTIGQQLSAEHEISRALATNIDSLKEAVRFAEMKAISARTELDDQLRKKTELENEIDALHYQMNKAQALDRNALLKRQQQVKQEMDLLVDKDYARRVQKLSNKFPPSRDLDDWDRE